MGVHICGKRKESDENNWNLQFSVTMMFSKIDHERFDQKVVQFNQRWEGRDNHSEIPKKKLSLFAAEAKADPDPDLESSSQRFLQISELNLKTKDVAWLTLSFILIFHVKNIDIRYNHNNNKEKKPNLLFYKDL